MNVRTPNLGPVSDEKWAPAITAAAVELPPNRHSQDEVVATLVDAVGPDFLRFAASSGVGTRQLALPLDRYPELTGFTEANAAYLDVAMDLGERAIRKALDAAGLQPSDVDIVFSTTVAGAAGIARMNDYLRAYPDQVAVLLAVELCSLTVQRDDHSMANLVACCLFGDGAAAVVATGARR